MSVDDDYRVLYYKLREKVKSKIKELESQKTDKLDIEFDDYDSPNYALNDQIKLLQELLKE